MSRPGRRASAVAREGRSGLLDRTALVLGVAFLAAALAAQGGRLSERLDLIANFAPVWLGGGCAVAVYGLLFAQGRRALLLASGCLAALASAALMVPEFLRPIPSGMASSHMIRVVQFNTWDETADATTSADWIAAQNPDVVVIEEAEPPIRLALVARGFVVTPGFGHVAIFSRATPVPRPAPLASWEWRRMPPFARAVFADGLGEYTVVAAHVPEPIYGVAAPQGRMLAELVNRYDSRRLLLAGDFNLTPWSFALRRLDGSLSLTRLDRAVFSWPARLSIGRWRLGTAPLLPIDHVYAGPGWRLVSLRRGPALGSDHFPLVIDLSAVD